MEPKDYFANLKTNLQDAQKEEFDRQMDTIRRQIVAAENIGQKAFLHKLSFTHEVIKKEQELLACGVKKYILKEDILKFLKDVKPKNSIKIIELERYPRPIPMDVLEEISRVKKLEIFDDFFVVFTDFTENSYETPDEKAMVERNRDPVVFGWFKLDKQGLKHDRCYYVADWIDDYCDLDFAKLVEKMSERGFAEPGTIKPGDVDYKDADIEKIVRESFIEMEKSTNRFEEVTARRIGFWGNLKEKIFG